MPDYSYPSWLTPKSEPWQSLVAGVAAGSQIAATRQRSQQMYAQAQQQQAHQDLAERQFVTQNEAATLHNEILRNKFTSDAADLSTMREWFPKFSASSELEDVTIPMFNNPVTTRAMSELYMQKRKTIGEGRLAGAIADSTKNGFSMDDPETIAAVAEVGKKWPEVVGSPAWNKTFDYASRAEKAQMVWDVAQAKLAAATPKQTSAMTNLKAADEADAQAKMLDVTNPEQAAGLRKNSALLRSTITAPSESIESYTDDQGHQQFRIIKGPNAGTATKDFSTPTTATATQIQNRLINADKSIEMGAKLMGTLTDADVGVRGNVNQVVINEGLAQLIPGLQKGQVTEARTMLGQFNENAMKAIASDPRISDKDRQRYEQILPTLGAVESLSSAKDKIRTFMDRFREQSRTDAIAAKLPVPNWALSVSELKAKVANKELTEDEAVKILVRYH